MENNNGSQFRYDLKDGVPTGLDYLAVSFTLGIIARGAGLDTWQAVAISSTNLINAGQFAALGIIQAGTPFMEMAVTQLIINLRYYPTSCSLSQKLKSGIPSFHRFFMAYGVVNEIFGVPVCRPRMLSPFYNYGLICVAVPDWTLGILLGAISGDLLPARPLGALNVTLYRMFLAVVIPPAKGSRILTDVILASMALSFLFTRIPALDHISSGSEIIIPTVMIAGVTAVLFPVKEEPINES